MINLHLFKYGEDQVSGINPFTEEHFNKKFAQGELFYHSKVITELTRDITDIENLYHHIFYNDDINNCVITYLDGTFEEITCDTDQIDAFNDLIDEIRDKIE